MAKSVAKILYDETKKLYDEILSKSGKVKNYMDLQATGAGARIMVPFWFSVFERGRKPRTSTESSGTSPNPELSMFEYNLFNWMRKKGKLRGTQKQQINQVKGLRYHINQEGTADYQKGKGQIVNDIYTSVLTEKRINEIVDKVGNIAIAEAYSEILKIK